MNRNELWVDTGDVAVCSRVVLARNICGYPFPERMSVRMAGEICDKLRCVLGEDYSFFALGRKKGYIRVPGDEDTGIILGEGDHIRIQSVLPGLALRAAFSRVWKIERILNAYLPFAFDAQLGYLTRSPEELGTALRCSVTLLLPGLSRLGRSEYWEMEAQTMDMLWLDGGAVNAFTIGNRLCLGRTEEELLGGAEEIAQRLIAAERSARQEV